MDIYELHRRAAYFLHEWDSPNGRTNREDYRDDFLTLLDCAHRVFRDNLDTMSKLPDSQCDPIIGLRKIEGLTRQCYEVKQAEQKKNFRKFIKELDREKTPPENVQYDYPDHPFIVGYRRPQNEVEWTVRQLNKAFNQQDNFQNPKWAWMGGELSENSISLLEKFVGQPWGEETHNIESIADLAIIADEFVTKNKFLGLLKSKLRRCCNIQDTDLLTWEEIFATIEEYLSNVQNGAEMKAITKEEKRLAMAKRLLDSAYKYTDEDYIDQLNITLTFLTIPTYDSFEELLCDAAADLAHKDEEFDIYKIDDIDVLNLLGSNPEHKCELTWSLWRIAELLICLTTDYLGKRPSIYKPAARVEEIQKAFRKCIKYMRDAISTQLISITKAGYNPLMSQTIAWQSLVDFSKNYKATKTQQESTGTNTDLASEQKNTGTNAGQQDTKRIGGFMNVSQLYKQFNVPDKNKQAFRKRLERFRKKNALDANAFTESQNKGGRQSKYLYNVKMIASIAEEVKILAASFKRPSKKKTKKN